MNSRERMLAVINHETPDRVPTDIWATTEVLHKLKEYFGQDADICGQLHIDGMASVEPKYKGPPLPAVGRGETVDYWGIMVEHLNSKAVGQIYEPLHVRAVKLPKGFQVNHWASLGAEVVSHLGNVNEALACFEHPSMLFIQEV